MYSLGAQKATLFKSNLKDGDVFLKYKQQSDKIYYLANLMTNKKEECFVKLKLDDDVKQKAQEENRIRLNFQNVDCQFKDVRKKGVILEAHIHDSYKSITIIRQGFLAVTLEKTKVDGKKQMKIKYYIESSVCRGIFVGDELYIESDLKS